jgi:hypothetical protein
MATFDEMRLEQLLGPYNKNNVGILNTTYSRPLMLSNLYNTANDDLVQQIINQRISALGNIAPMPVNTPTGIISTPQATNMFTDDAGYEPESYEEFAETGTVKSGLKSLFDKVKNSKVAGLALSAINPVLGAVKGVASLFGGPRVGVVGGQNLYGDSTFDTFGRSTSLADFAQRMRDKRAREAAAARGSVKELQSRIDRGDFDGGKFSDKNTGITDRGRGNYGGNGGSKGGSKGGAHGMAGRAAGGYQDL